MTINMPSRWGKQLQTEFDQPYFKAIRKWRIFLKHLNAAHLMKSKS